MKLVYGFGTNDSPAPVRVNGKTIPSYKRWQNMLQRCYCPKFLALNPTYVGCSVHEDWLLFSNFQRFFDKNYIQGYQLDKDLLIHGNREYSEGACVFVPQWLNPFVNEKEGARGKYLIGASLLECGKFVSQCRNPITKKPETLGRFLTEQEAHDTWKNRKAEHVRNMKSVLDAIDTRIYPNLLLKYQ